MALGSVTTPGWFRQLTWLTALLCLAVAVFGSFVRLSNAGLSCPDWPTCYGKATWPVHDHEVDAANAAFPEREVETDKAWREQVHRHLAATLGLLVLILCAWSVRGDRIRRWLLLTTVLMVGFAIPLYMRGEHLMAGVLAAAGEALLLIAAVGFSPDRRSRLLLLTLAVVIFQALLGMWTVTWKLKPLVVMGHLLGGLTTLFLLSWLAWSTRRRDPLGDRPYTGLRVVLPVLGLLALQIALGGWVSSNYAALACPQFPQCNHDEFFPATDFQEAFVLWRGIGVDYEGGVLDPDARTAIHLSHRMGAIVAGLGLLWLGFRLLRDRALRIGGILLLGLTAGQIALGIGNVVWSLPLPVATAHNAGAALLVVAFAWLLSRLRPAQAAAP